MEAKRAMVLVVAMTFLTLAFAGCLGPGSKVDNTQDVSDDAIPSPIQTPSSNPASSSEPSSAQCSKPWPSKIDMIQIPDSMVAGQTYIFKCQLFVQNYDTDCHASPWWYGVDAPITWTFTNGNGVSMTNHTKTCSTYGIAKVAFLCPEGGVWAVAARWSGNDNYVEAEGRSTVSATPPDECFTNLSVEGPYDLGEEAPYWSEKTEAVADPFLFDRSNLSQIVSITATNHYYYLRFSADAKQAYIDRMVQAGWGTSGVNNSAIAAKWVLEINAPGILPTDVTVFGGEGNLSEKGRMDFKSLTQKNETSIVTTLDSAPYEGTITQMTDPPNITNMHAEVPSLIKFMKPGQYTMVYYLIDQTTGAQVSPKFVMTASASDSSASPRACDKPWPSKLEMIEMPENMTPGQTYSFQASVSIQDYDYNCTPTSWQNAANLSVVWTVTGDQGESFGYERMTTSEGFCSIEFQCPSAGAWTVTAQLAGNDSYQASFVSIMVMTN